MLLTASVRTMLADDQPEFTLAENRDYRRTVQVSSESPSRSVIITDPSTAW